MNQQHLGNNGIAGTGKGGEAETVGGKSDIMAVRSRRGGQVQIRPSEIRARVQLTFAPRKGQRNAISKTNVFLTAEVGSKPRVGFPPKAEVTKWD